MSDQNANAQATNTEQGNGSDSQKSKTDEIPEYVQQELSRARNDAAKYRTRLRETEDALKSAQDELKSATDKAADFEVKYNDTVLNNLKIEAALEVGVPGEHLKAFADRLRGTNAEELKADAEAAKNMFGVGTPGRATDSTAGLGGNQPKKTPEGAFGDFIRGRLSR